MSVLTDKDRIDAKPAVLKSHVDAALHLKDAYPENIYYSYVLNPRVFNEVMTDYRGAIAAAFPEEAKAAFREDPKAIWSWIEENIKVCPEAEQESVYFVPTASLKIRKSSELSRHILFVANCQNARRSRKTQSDGRSYGISDAGFRKTGSRGLREQQIPGRYRRKSKRGPSGIHRRRSDLDL